MRVSDLCAAVILAFVGAAIATAQLDKPKANEKGPETEDERVREVPWMVAPLMISAAASVLLGLFPMPVLALAGKVADSVFQLGSASR